MVGHKVNVLVGTVSILYCHGDLQLHYVHKTCTTGITLYCWLKASYPNQGSSQFFISDACRKNESTLVHNAWLIDFACWTLYKFMLIMFMYASYLHNGLLLRSCHSGQTLTHGKVLNTGTPARRVIHRRLVLC